jgi:transglutaminase-like putative cysteine protease
VTLTQSRRPLADPTRPAPPRRTASRRPRGELLTAALLAAGLLFAYAGMHVLLQGISWFVVGAVLMLLVLVVANIARRLVRRPWLPTVIAGAVVLLALTAGYGADRALLGLIPTPDVFGRFSRLADEAWLSISEQALPATPELGIVFLLALLTAGCALFADIVVRRAPALVAIPLLTLLGVPVAVRSGVADPVWYVAAALVYLMILRRGQGLVLRPSVLGLGAAVVVGSLLLPSVLPTVQESESGSGSGVDSSVNPLINLGDDLRRGSAVTAVTYSTSSGAAVYLRLATLDRFDGREWLPTGTQPPRRNTVARFPAPPGLESGVERTTVTASVKVGGITGRWLPVPYPASRITGLDGDWRWVESGLSVRSQDTNAGGQSYKVSFVDVKPNLTQLRSATLDAAQAVDDRSLPGQMPSIIPETARRVTAGAATEYDKALALQNWFTSDGGFSYSESAPVRGGYDGTGTQIIAEFLQKKAGYCVHFASAMAVMARTLGIPARVAVGFQPGTATTENGKPVFTVTSHDLHAWPELYFAGIGWLRFEPTPGRGAEPIYSQPSAVDDSISQGTASDAASAAPSGDATDSGAAATDPASDASDAATPGSRGERTADPAPWIVLGIALVIVLLLLTPAVVRILTRARRMRAVARGRDAAAAAWAELRDTARDHGWSAPETETPREFAGRLAAALAAERAAIGVLQRGVEATAYARDPGPITAGQLRAVTRGIARATSGRDRLRAVFLPPSLVERVRGRVGIGDDGPGAA